MLCGNLRSIAGTANKTLGRTQTLEKIPTNPAGPVAVVALALVDSQDRVLMQRRPPHKQHGGLWEFPGGKVEPGEGPRAALVREVAEELAIAVRAQDLAEFAFSASEGGNGAPPVLLLLYLCHCWQGDPRAVEAGTELAWIDRRALSGLATPPLDVPLVAALQALPFSVTK